MGGNFFKENLRKPIIFPGCFSRGFFSSKYCRRYGLKIETSGFRGTVFRVYIRLIDRSKSIVYKIFEFQAKNYCDDTKIYKF